MYYTPLRIGGISSRDFRYKVCDVHFPEFHLGISLTVRMRSQILMILGETKGLNPKIQELQQLTYPKGASMGVFVIFGSCISCISF